MFTELKTVSLLSGRNTEVSTYRTAVPCMQLYSNFFSLFYMTQKLHHEIFVCITII